jgi:hypothetical protein
LRAAPHDVAVAGFLGDFGDKFIAPIFGKPLNFERESIGARDGRTVLFAIDRKAVADQDLSGMTVAEERLSCFGDVFRERDFSFCALALAAACADFPFPVFDDPDGFAPFSGC